MPRYEPAVYEDSFVHPMISKTFEEDSPPEQRNLNRMDVDIGAVIVPGVSANTVR